MKNPCWTACAQDAGKFTAYHDVLFENQPMESDDAFADKGRLIDLAGKVEGLDTPAFRTCVEDGTHNNLLSRPDGLYAMLWRMQSDTVSA